MEIISISPVFCHIVLHLSCTIAKEHLYLYLVNIVVVRVLMNVESSACTAVKVGTFTLGEEM